MTAPQFACSLSTNASSEAAERECAAALIQELGGAQPDLLAVFATHHHGSALEGLGQRLQERLGSHAVLGCTGENVIGGSREVEGQPGMTLWAAVLPETEVRPFTVTAIPGPDDEPLFQGEPDVGDASRASMLLLADPYSFPTDRFLDALHEQHPGLPCMGGMASGGMGPGQNFLLTEEGLQAQGAVGVVLEGGVEIRPVVSQGCRPIGKPWVVTACEQNVIEKLGGRPALEVLHETMQELSPADLDLFQRGPFVGLAVDAAKSTFERGDFLVRGLMGLVREKHALAVASLVRRGQTVQFLVRDAESAGEDLTQLMRSQGGGELVDDDGLRRAGALLFSCNGRGTHMFPTPDHDVSCVRAGLAADVPVAGFFAAGEIGPVGGRNFVHGFTASVAVFRPRGA